MNEELVLKMAEPSVKDGKLTYSLFDKIFAVLSRKEQYLVCEILNNNGIQLVDSYDEEDNVPDEHDLLDSDKDDLLEEDANDPLYDEKLFQDTDEQVEYLVFNDNITESNNTLLRQVQRGSQQAKQDICIKNQNLVGKYASIYYHYFGNDLEFDDLMQAGYIGLLKAAEKFDFRKDLAFSTYAVLWIKQAIRRELEDFGYRIRIPVHMMEKIARLTRLDNKYGADGLEYQERVLRIAEDMETTPETIEDLFEIKHHFLGSVSLDTPVGEEEEISLGDLIPAEDAYSVEDEYFKRELTSALNEVLSTLKPREQLILRLRFGLDDGKQRTLAEIGEMYGLTRERVRQIEAKALRKLRHPSRNKKIIDFYN